MSRRRLQTWPGDLVHDKLLDSPLPVWLSEPIVSRLLSIPISDGDKTTNLFSTSPHKHPNHVLINEYPPGVGIMPHKVGLWEGDYAEMAALRRLISVLGRSSLLPGRMYC